MTDPGHKAFGSWLKLGEAADYLGVHFATLRRWANDGKVPHLRTPGGQRRFDRRELDAFLESLRHGGSRALAPAQEPHGRLQIDRPVPMHPGMGQETWYGRLDDAQRSAMRTEGRQLMAVLMQYATRSDDGEVFLQEGQRLASEYGKVCHSVDLSLVEMARAFIVVRRSVNDAVTEAGSLAGPRDADTWRLYDRTNYFLDTMLLTMLDAYDCAQRRELKHPQA